MNNFRVAPRSGQPRQIVDGISRATAARQTLQKPTVIQPIVTRVPNPAMPAAAAPTGRCIAPVPAAVLPEMVPVPEAARPSPFDIATIEETVVPKNRLSAGRAFKTWLLRGGLITAVLLIAVGGVLFTQGMSKVHKVFRGNSRPAGLTATASQLLKGESSGRVNVLLLGNGGDGHEAPDLTDTMIVESIDTVHKTAAMISVPRDLWVHIPQYGDMKINAAYEVGKYNYLGKIDDSNSNTQAVEAGFSQADQAIKTVLGLNIDYNVLVNFKSFKQAVDAVGGVQLTVAQPLVDPTMAWQNNHNPVLAPAGTYTMNGNQALLYVRSRETSSDFARSQRQRQVILALKEKALTLGTLSNPIKISQLVNAFGDNLVTDFSLSEALRAYDLGKNVTNDKIASIDLVTPPNNLVTTGSMNGVSIDQPRAGLFQYTEIQQFIQQSLGGKTASPSQASTQKPENAQISVLNGTTRVGLASSKAAVLKANGYNVVSVGNAPTKTYTKTVVVDLSGSSDPTTKAYLEKTFGVSAVTSLPDQTIQSGTANFVVILGTDQP